MRLVLPNTKPDLSAFRDQPLFYLDGPVHGGGDWQWTMTNLFAGFMGDCVIVHGHPCGSDHPHFRRRLVSSEAFRHLSTWAEHFRELAARDWSGGGCLVFWLARESKEHPWRGTDPYAADVRRSLAAWRARMVQYPDLRIVVGADDDFIGLPQIECTFKALLPGSKIHRSMEVVLDHAAAHVLRQRCLA